MLGLRPPNLVPSFRIKKVQRRYFVSVPVGKYAPETFKGSFINLSFLKKPTRRKIEFEVLKFYKEHPDYWYHWL